MTNLVIMVGVCGSGKSTLATNLKNYYGHLNLYTNYYGHFNPYANLISSDQIRIDLFGDVNDQTHNEEVFKEVRRRINNCIDKMNVIVDATNLTVKSRKPMLDIVRNNTNVRKIAMVMCTPRSVCKMQNRKRERTVADYVIDRQAGSFEIPFYEEGFDEINLIDWNSNYFSYAKNELEMMQIDNTYYGELMKGFEQKNSHHKYTLDIHCQKCAEEVAKRTDNEVLIRTAEIHDYGKMFTQRLKDDGSGEYCYYNHHNIGCYEMLHPLSFIGFNNYNKCLECLFYINFHMLPFFIQTEKSQQKWEKIMGKEKLDNLFLFNECDKIASGTQ